MKSDGESILNWVITLLLIAIIGVVFIFVGTESDAASPVGCIAAISCLVLALVILVVYIWRRYRHTSVG